MRTGRSSLEKKAAALRLGRALVLVPLIGLSILQAHGRDAAGGSSSSPGPALANM